ncbi:hypothetical protein [Alteromonas sp. H39]|uniref:hypothetical protein n=1 Tax=Alteromonas sp. H39 TaxID=3389876 RepID=UPI0039E02F2A
MNIVLTQPHYSDNMWALFLSASDSARFLLQGEGVYLIQSAPDKLTSLRTLFVLESDIKQRSVALIKHATPCSLTVWLENAANDLPWATF